jgi:hypothetical protein
VWLNSAIIKITMITREQAEIYANTLHPAFAGYFHDGIVNESDALATIFYLIKKGFLEPEFTDNNITRGIEFVRKTSKKPTLPFEQTIIDAIFLESKHVSAAIVGGMIKNGAIQAPIAAAAVNYSGNPIAGASHYHANHQKASTFTFKHKRIIQVVSQYKPPYLFLALFFLPIALISLIEKDYESAMKMGIPGLAFLMLYLTGHVPLENTKYDYIVVPKNKYYEELHEFLEKHPPRPHDFTYEYIPFAIAFNLDTSWYRDFGLTMPKHPKAVHHHVSSNTHHNN